MPTMCIANINYYLNVYFAQELMCLGFFVCFLVVEWLAGYMELEWRVQEGRFDVVSWMAQLTRGADPSMWENSRNISFDFR